LKILNYPKEDKLGIKKRILADFCVTIIYVFGGSAASRLESVSVCFHFFARDSLLKEFGTTNIMLKV